MNNKIYFILVVFALFFSSCTSSFKVKDLYKIEKKYFCTNLTNFLDTASNNNKKEVARKITLILDSNKIKKSYLFDCSYNGDSLIKLRFYLTNSKKSSRNMIIGIKNNDVFILGVGFMTGGRRKKLIRNLRYY
jgi:predicted Zn-dependent protease